LSGWAVITDGPIQDIIRELAQDAGYEALLQIGISQGEGAGGITDLVNERGVAYARERSAELVTMIDESTREMLRGDVETAMQEGWSTDMLARQIEDNYAFSADRAETIARTETAFADVAGNMDGWRASGVVESKQWILGEGACDDCQELEDIIVGLEDSFDFVDGPIEGPPAHPNCRCDLLPILSESEQDDEEA
jgi:SPP1 gp7 family putative phage head morphogenesis protein